MTCEDYSDLMMAYLDDELDDSQRQRFEAHLAGCDACRQALADFRQLKGLTDGLSLNEPEDEVWHQYWNQVYNRIERGTGWALFSVAAIGLLTYGGVLLVERLLKDPGIAMFCKICVVTLVLGTAILLVSVVRERLYFWRRDRYKDVRR